MSSWILYSSKVTGTNLHILLVTDLTYDIHSGTGPNITNSINEETPTLVWHIRNACIPTWILIITFGLVGNILTVALLSSPNLRRHSTSIYLRWLAVVDILYLLCSLSVNLIGYVTFFPDTLRDRAYLLCLGLPFLHYTLSYLSVWLLVAVTVDRMIWVVLPFHARKICNHKNAFIVAVSLVGIFTCLDIHFFFTLTFKLEANSSLKDPTHSCEPDSFINNIYPYIDLVLLLLIPIMFMIVCNSAIIFKLRRIKKIRQTRLQGPTETIKEKSQSHSSKKRKKASIGSSSLTAMLLSINIFFVVSITPLLVYDIVYFAADLRSVVSHNEAKFGGILFGIEQIVYTVWYLHFAAHFLIYCMSGPRFRSEAVKLFCCKGLRPQETQDEAVTELMTRRISSHYRH